MKPLTVFLAFGGLASIGCGLLILRGLWRLWRGPWEPWAPDEIARRAGL